jgi:hypothetical protein
MLSDRKAVVKHPAPACMALSVDDVLMLRWVSQAYIYFSAIA